MALRQTSVLLCSFLALIAIAPAGRAQTPIESPTVSPSPQLELMISAGDSLTAAFIANTHVGDSSSLRSLSVRTRGDHKETLSWATGREVDSHYVRLQRYLSQQGGHSLVDLNVAKSGAQSDDLERQAGLVLEEWNTGRYASIPYVTLLIGANNLCSRHVVQEEANQALVEDVQKFFFALAKIRQEGPIRVLVSSIPRLPDLNLPNVASHRAIANLTCGQVQRTLAVCTNPLDWEGSDDYLFKVRQVEKTNRQLQERVRLLAALLPQFEFHYSDQFFNASISTDDLAADCFHPNVHGHQVLSQKLWDDLPWFKDGPGTR